MKIKIFVAGLTTLLCFSLFGETFSLDECIERSVKESEKIKAVQEGEKAAKSGKDAAIFSFLPSAKLEAGYQWLGYDPKQGKMTFNAIEIPISFPDTNKTLSITVVQPITPLWSVSYGYKSLEAAYDIAKMQRELSTNQLKLEVMNLFYNYQLLLETLETLNETKEQLRKYYKQANDFYTAGLADKRSVLKIDIQSAQIDQQIQTVVGNVKIIKKNLAILMNVDSDSFEIEKVAAKNDSLQVGASQLEEIMFGNRVELKMLEKSSDVAAYSEKLAIQPLIPTLAVVGGYSHNWSGGGTSPIGTMFIGGSLSWDFGFNWGKTAFEIKQAKHNKVKTKFENSAKKREISLQLIQLQNDVETKKIAIEISQKEIESATENLRIEEDKYKEKMTTETDLLAASISLRSAKLNLLTALYQHEVALHTLAITIGTDYENIISNEVKN